MNATDPEGALYYLDLETIRVEIAHKCWVTMIITKRLLTMNYN